MQPQHLTNRLGLTLPLVDTSRLLPPLHPNGRLFSSCQVPQSRVCRLRNSSQQNSIPTPPLDNRSNAFPRRESGFAATLFCRFCSGALGTTDPPPRDNSTRRSSSRLVKNTNYTNYTKFSTTTCKMVKPDAQVIEEFKGYVNMTPDELEAWLKTQNSIGAGIRHEGASESVGHESGGHILDIMKRNPTWNEGNYTDGKSLHKMSDVRWGMADERYGS